MTLRKGSTRDIYARSFGGVAGDIESTGDACYTVVPLPERPGGSVNKEKDRLDYVIVLDTFVR